MNDDPILVKVKSSSGSIDFKPKYFLRCHSKQRKDVADVQTQVWQCAFEPTGPEETAKIVATCGGNSVCFIDVETGQMRKKYYSSNRENFMALAWTKIDDRKILAVGGSIQTINFILYEQGFCFHEEKFDKTIMGVKCAITSLLFNPKTGNLLYCSCSDGKILMFQLDTTIEPNFVSEVVLLHKFQVSCEVFLLIYFEPWDILLGTSDDGIYCWNGNKQLISEGEVKKGKTLLQFKGRPLALTESPSLVDTAEILENGLIASKCALHGSIYIWNLETVLGEERVPAVDRNIRITPLYQLAWSSTDNYFMYLGYDAGSKWLSCGDDRGAIWMYDIAGIVKGEAKPFDGEMMNPTIVLEWPNLNDQYSSRKRKLDLGVHDIVINKTILNHNSKYMVAVTNNNMVCIWKRKK